MKEDSSSARPIEDLPALVTLTELVDIHPYRISGTRHLDALSAADTEQQDMALRVSRDAYGLEARLSLTLVTSEAELIADIGARYHYSEPLEVDDSVIAEFVQRVAVMNAFPYLRESVYTTATRLGVAAPVLGLLRAGQLRVTPPGVDRDVELTTTSD